MKDPYRVLELNSNATFKEVTEKYRLLIQDWRPDKHIDSTPRVKLLAEKKIKELTVAFQSIEKSKDGAKEESEKSPKSEDEKEVESKESPPKSEDKKKEESEEPPPKSENKNIPDKINFAFVVMFLLSIPILYVIVGPLILFIMWLLGYPIDQL